MNRYIVEKRLGEGAFGLVFLAIHKDSGRRVAIKRMRRPFSSWEECLKLREVQILQNVRHPGIVELLEAFRENERLHLVFDYVVGFCFESLFAERILSYLYLKSNEHHV